MSDLPPTRDPACATRPRGPPRRVVAAPPDGLGEFAALVMSGSAPAVTMIDREFMREVLRYIAALERERDDAGSFW
jgi:hypothetical protein